MKAANLAGAVLGAILKVAFAVIVVYLVYTGASTCYDYGYRIFTEPAISSGEGRKITVTLTSDMSATEIGNTLQEKGLVRDGRLFALQYLLSEYKKDWKPGTYELSTAMTAEEMMVLTEKLADMHANLYGYERTITDDDLMQFIKIEYARVGADTNITPREIIRDFIEILDIIWQNPDTKIADLLNSDQFSYAKSEAVSDNKEKDYTEFKL